MRNLSVFKSWSLDFIFYTFIFFACYRKDTSGYVSEKCHLLSFQSIIFHVERHPRFTWFEQCVTFNFFPTEQHELAYNLFNVITVYLLPLVIITTSYSLILYKVSKTARRDEGMITRATLPMHVMLIIKQGIAASNHYRCSSWMEI